MPNAAIELIKYTAILMTSDFPDSCLASLSKSDTQVLVKEEILHSYNFLQLI